MLHGTIAVNDEVIGVWKAVRQEHPPEEVNSYKVRVDYRDISGVVHEAETVLHHQFDKGAIFLISEIMQWAAEAITPTPETHEDALDRLPLID